MSEEARAYCKANMWSIVSDVVDEDQCEQYVGKYLAYLISLCHGEDPIEEAMKIIREVFDDYLSSGRTRANHIENVNKRKQRAKELWDKWNEDAVTFMKQDNRI